MSNTLSTHEWLQRGIEAGILPATITIDAASKIGGGTMTFATPDLALVISPLIYNGLKQKCNDKVANEKAAAQLNNAAALQAHFVGLFKRGIWNERPGGGPRVDAKEAFIRMQALREAKLAHKKAGGKMDDVDALDALMRVYAKDEARLARYEQAWEILNPEE